MGWITGLFEILEGFLVFPIFTKPLGVLVVGAFQVDSVTLLRYFEGLLGGSQGVNGFSRTERAHIGKSRTK